VSRRGGGAKGRKEDRIGGVLPRRRWRRRVSGSSRRLPAWVLSRVSASKEIERGSGRGGKCFVLRITHDVELQTSTFARELPRPKKTPPQYLARMHSPSMPRPPKRLEFGIFGPVQCQYPIPGLNANIQTHSKGYLNVTILSKFVNYFVHTYIVYSNYDGS
jgi:hypothetical protein